MSKSFGFTEGEEIKDSLPEAHNFEENKVLQGYLVGVEENVGMHNSRVYKFEVAEGEIVSVWGKAQLNKLMSVAEIGKAYSIEFVGLEDIKDSENKFQKFQVRSLEVA